MILCVMTSSDCDERRVNERKVKMIPVQQIFWLVSRTRRTTLETFGVITSREFVITSCEGVMTSRDGVFMVVGSAESV